jgi:hypothetical protein
VTKHVTVILGQYGGPISSTSMAEALSVGCWSSTPRGRQVVRPRLSGGRQGLDLVVGNGRSSIMRSELGGDASSSPAVRGRDYLGPDCFFSILVRVVFVKWKALSSNFRFLWARDVKGLFCKMYLPLGSV